ncbi:MAG: hypothetical protein ACPG46_01100 [Thalassotalea sp.]
MQYTESQATPIQADEQSFNVTAVEQQLAQAREEIADLKSQIMWLERSYE